MKFYFATSVAGNRVQDEDGVDLADAGAAMQLALQTLGEMARDAVAQMPSGSALIVEVSDAEGDPVCAVRLDFSSRSAPITKRSS